jgi:hypothetical protein
MVEIVIRDEYARVVVDGNEVKAFSLLAEDYAIVLAHNYAHGLEKDSGQQAGQR